MKASVRFLVMAIAGLVIALAAIVEVQAQPFPQCNAGGITINNRSRLPVTVCIKYVGCFDVPAGRSIFVRVPLGQEVPGIAGVANITHVWQTNPVPPPALWIPSIAMNPTGNCFDVFYDETSCTMDVVQTSGPPCINP
jgi:hypothetical protein